MRLQKALFSFLPTASTSVSLFFLYSLFFYNKKTRNHSLVRGVRHTSKETGSHRRLRAPKKRLRSVIEPTTSRHPTRRQQSHTANTHFTIQEGSQNNSTPLAPALYCIYRQNIPLLLQNIDAHLHRGHAGVPHALADLRHLADPVRSVVARANIADLAAATNGRKRTKKQDM